MRLRTLALTLVVSCLLPLASADAVSRGRAVTPGEAPWLVAIPGMQTAACGGVLVAPDKVLTAAHCVQGLAPSDLRLRLGDGAMSAGRRLTVARIVFPRAYRLIPSPVAPDDPGASGSVRDIAVLHLAAPVSDVAPLPIATSEPQPGEATTTYGRGRTGPPPAPSKDPGQQQPPDTGRGPSAPLAADQVVVADGACAQPYGKVLHPATHLCTENPESKAQACSGDSGGPVVVRRDGQPQLAGLVTWGGEVRGRDCGEGLPDVSEQPGAYASLLTQAGSAPSAARRTRVRRSRGVLDCVSGPWKPATAKLRYAWYRPGERTAREVAPGVTAIGRGPDEVVRGLTAKRVRARGTALGCVVRADTAAGWAEERSYNQR